ncbi:TonB-dependent receptor, partial [Arcobacter sp. CECT 8985]|uniref:TonB-dependent receptor n=1 Tax=Arcobacter sp. CECT 8985 TaxID=1935424 RepID=UPI00100AC49C
QLNSDYNKFYKDIDSDYMKNKDNITRGIELTFEKDFFESYLISTTFFIANNDYDYIYKKHTSNKKHRINSLSKGLNFSIDKSISDNFKVVTAAKISQNKIKDSNEKYLIGNNVKNKANTQLALNLEYKINKIKLFSRFTHMSSRYANDKNSKKLDPYTIGTIGSSFYTKVKNRDIKFDFNIKNIFNKKYYIDSDTQGDLRNYFFNMIMSF